MIKASVIGAGWYAADSHIPTLAAQRDVVLDGGFQGYSSDPIPVGGCPTNTMYFLNTRYVKYRPHRDRNFNAIGPKRMSVNQDATVKLMGWAGNMTISNRRLQGVLFNS